MAKSKQRASAGGSCRSLRAVQRFRCIGDRCENTCCQTWNVSLTKQDYVGWRNKARKQPQELALFERHVPKGGDFYASIAFDNESGACPFLDGCGLCRVHERLGESALAMTCRTYPKAFTLERDQVLASGSLGCPEYVRTLLASDEAIDVVDAPVPAPNNVVLALESHGQDWHWQRCLPEIAELGLAMLTDRATRASVPERLYVLVAMMLQIGEAGCSAQQPLSLPLLSQRVAPLLDAGGRESVVQQFRQLPPPDPSTGVQLVLRLFAHRLSLEQRDIAPLWDAIYASYADIAAPSGQTQTTTGGFALDIEATTARFLDRRQRLHALAGEQLQRSYLRLFANQFFNGSPRAKESPLGYLARHIVTLSLLDFALCSHRGVDPLLQQNTPLSPSQREQLQAQLVELVTQVGRTLLHTKAFTQATTELLACHAEDPLALLSALLKGLEGGLEEATSAPTAPAAGVAS